MSRIDVVCYEIFEEEERALRQALPSQVRARFIRETVQAVGEKVPPAPLISIRTQSRIPLDWAGSVSGILTRSRGYDHLTEFRQAAGAGTACGYLEDYCSRAVAEQAGLMMLALGRNLNKQTAAFKTFTRDGLTGMECRGRHALVIGVGHIGREIVDVARGLRMAVKGMDIAPALKDLEYVPLAEGVAWADVIFCALPLTRDTEGMLHYDLLKTVRPGALFINIARGEIAPVEDLKRLMAEEALGGLGMDVCPQEGELADALRQGEEAASPSGQVVTALARRDNVIFTPHNAFNTEEALARKAALSAAAIVAYLTTGIFPLCVPTV